MPESTCWTLIEAAADGAEAARADFARRYGPVVRAYLGARWRRAMADVEVEDAVQEVFVECLREGGVLERAEEGRGEGFRAFLLGAARKVALRVEARRGRRRDGAGSQPFDGDALEAREEALSRAFDRAWAEAVLEEASRLQEERARGAGERERRWVELLRRRFADGESVSAVGRSMGLDPRGAHHEYGRALAEFERCLRSAMEFHHPGAPEDAARECRALLELLQ